MPPRAVCSNRLGGLSVLIDAQNWDLYRQTAPLFLFSSVNLTGLRKHCIRQYRLSPAARAINHITSQTGLMCGLWNFADAERGCQPGTKRINRNQEPQGKRRLIVQDADQRFGFPSSCPPSTQYNKSIGETCGFGQSFAAARRCDIFHLLLTSGLRRWLATSKPAQPMF